MPWVRIPPINGKCEEGGNGMEAVWPDVGIKGNPNSSKVAQKVVMAGFT